MQTKPSRDVRIACIRMISTLMIVALHIFQEIGEGVTFHVVTDWLNLGLVMFCCISGFLYSQRQIPKVGQWLIHRYSEILIPSLLVGIVTIAVFAALGSMTTGRVIDVLLSCAGGEPFVDNSWMFVHLWFLTYLLVFYLAVPLLQKLPCHRGSELKFWSILAGATVLLQILMVVLERILNFQLLSVGVLLRFYLPYLVFRRYDIHSKQLQKIMYLLTALAVLLIGGICYIRYFVQIESLAAVSELVFIYIQTLAGFVLFYWLYKSLIFIKSYGAILRTSDKLSYPIYLVHCLFIGYNTSAMYWVDNLLVGVLLALVLTAISSVALYYLTALIKNCLPIKSSKKPGS